MGVAVGAGVAPACMRAISSSKETTSLSAAKAVPLVRRAAVAALLAPASAGADVLTATAKGFASDVTVNITLENGAIAAMTVDASGETAGLGQLAMEEEFTSQFIGKSAPLTLGDGIDAISGATITSQAVVDAANEKYLKMGEEAHLQAEELAVAINEQLRRALEAGDPAGPEARRLVAMHSRWLCMYWPEGTYTPEAHKGLADGYLADERFRAYYEKVVPGATQFLRDAIHACA